MQEQPPQKEISKTWPASSIQVFFQQLLQIKPLKPTKLHKNNQISCFQKSIAWKNKIKIEADKNKKKSTSRDVETAMTLRATWREDRARFFILARTDASSLERTWSWCSKSSPLKIPFKNRDTTPSLPFCFLFEGVQGSSSMDANKLRCLLPLLINFLSKLC